MLDVNGATSESSYEINLAGVQQVIALAVEAGMLLLLDLENNIAGLNARCLVTLTTELDLGTALDALIDVDVKDFAVNNGLLTTALLAAILFPDNFTLSTAVGADCLETLDHGTHLAHHGLHTLTVTAGALLNSPILAADTLTLGADNGALEGKLGDLASVDVLEGDFVGVVNGASLGWSALATTEHASHAAEATAATEELRKQVLSSHTATTTGAALEASLTILIVD